MSQVAQMEQFTKLPTIDIRVYPYNSCAIAHTKRAGLNFKNQQHPHLPSVTQMSQLLREVTETK